MSNPRAHLIETAVRPFGENAEMKAAAADFLDGFVKPEPEDSDQAVARWEKLDREKPRPVWRWLLFILLCVSAAVVSMDAVPRISGFISAYKILSSLGSSSPGPAGPTPEYGRNDLTEEERWVLYGDEAQSSKSGKAKGLWDRHPENAAYFAQYAEAHLSEHGSLPPDFLETARKIDPRNAWFTYLAAGAEAKQAVSRKNRSAARRADLKPPQYEILDQKRLDRSLQLIREARNQPLMNDYKAGLFREKMPLLAQANPLEKLTAISYLAGMTASDLIVMRNLGNAIGAKASRLATEHNVREFQDLVNDTETLTRQMLATEPSTVVAGLVCQVTILATSESLAAAAKELGLEEEAGRFQAIHDKIRQGTDAKKNRNLLVDGVEFRRKSDFISGLTIPMVSKQVANPPVVTDADLKPGRFADHERIAIFHTLGMISILGLVILGCWAFRYRQGAFSARLSKRMETLLVPGDWLQIIGMGVVVPFLLVIFLNRFTPLGGRDLNVFEMKFILPIAHYSALLQLVLILPILMTRFRLGRRIGGLGFPRGKSWPGWISAVFILVFVVQIGIAVKPLSPGPMTTAAGLFVGFSQVWLLFTAVRAVFAGPVRVLMAGVVTRVLIPCYATAMLLTVWLLAALLAAEAYWFRNDHFTKLDPARPGMTPYEYEVSVQLQKETREVVGYDR